MKSEKIIPEIKPPPEEEKADVRRISYCSRRSGLQRRQKNGTYERILRYFSLDLSLYIYYFMIHMYEIHLYEEHTFDKVSTYV